MANIILYEEPGTKELKTAGSIQDVVPALRRETEENLGAFSKFSRRVGEERKKTNYNPNQVIYFGDVVK